MARPKAKPEVKPIETPQAEVVAPEKSAVAAPQVVAPPAPPSAPERQVSMTAFKGITRIDF